MSQEVIPSVSASLENGTKICTKCHQVKKFEEFPIDRRRKDHRGIICKECQKKRKGRNPKEKAKPCKGILS